MHRERSKNRQCTGPRLRNRQCSPVAEPAVHAQQRQRSDSEGYRPLTQSPPRYRFLVGKPDPCPIFFGCDTQTPAHLFWLRMLLRSNPWPILGGDTQKGTVQEPAVHRSPVAEPAVLPGCGTGSACTATATVRLRRVPAPNAVPTPVPFFGRKTRPLPNFFWLRYSNPCPFVLVANAFKIEPLANFGWRYSKKWSEPLPNFFCSDTQKCFQERTPAQFFFGCDTQFQKWSEPLPNFFWWSQRCFGCDTQKNGANPYPYGPLPEPSVHRERSETGAVSGAGTGSAPGTVQEPAVHRSPVAEPAVLPGCGTGSACTATATVRLRRVPAPNAVPTPVPFFGRKTRPLPNFFWLRYSNPCPFVLVANAFKIEPLANFGWRYSKKWSEPLPNFFCSDTQKCFQERTPAQFFLVAIHNSKNGANPCPIFFGGANVVSVAILKKMERTLTHFFWYRYSKMFLLRIFYIVLESRVCPCGSMADPLRDHDYAVRIPGLVGSRNDCVPTPAVAENIIVSAQETSTAQSIRPRRLVIVRRKKNAGTAGIIALIIYDIASE